MVSPGKIGMRTRGEKTVRKPVSRAPLAQAAWDLLLPRPALAQLRSADTPAAKTVRDIAALFVDIEGCVRLCDDLPLREMTEVIEVYFGRYLDAVRAAGGDVTEVLGDGVLAIFEGPDLAHVVEGALAATIEISEATRALNTRRGRRHEPIVVNMGLNAGAALTGFTRLRGRLAERWVYGASGPVTNVAARLCAMARGGQILTTRATAAFLPVQHRYRVLGQRRLKNVARSVEVIEILPGSRVIGNGRVG
jgi:class 3 adenylate cyclase